MIENPKVLFRRELPGRFRPAVRDSRDRLSVSEGAKLPVSPLFDGVPQRGVVENLSDRDPNVGPRFRLLGLHDPRIPRERGSRVRSLFPRWGGIASAAGALWRGQPRTETRLQFELLIGDRTTGVCRHVVRGGLWTEDAVIVHRWCPGSHSSSSGAQRRSGVTSLPRGSPPHWGRCPEVLVLGGALPRLGQRSPPRHLQ